VTLLCAWLFHRVVKWPALRVAPEPIARRLAAFADRPWMPAWTLGATALLVLSALLGALTHDVWDGFTHGEMWGPKHIASLRELYAVPVLGLMPAHRILQHTCTVIGLPVLAFLAGRALYRVKPVDVQTGGRLLWFAAVAGCTVAAYAKIWRHHETDIGSLVVAPCCGLLGGALLAGVITSSRRIRRRQS
jgi:hypothetical protein